MMAKFVRQLLKYENNTSYLLSEADVDKLLQKCFLV